MIHLMLKHITYKNSLSKVITKSFHPTLYDVNKTALSKENVGHKVLVLHIYI